MNQPVMMEKTLFLIMGSHLFPQEMLPSLDGKQLLMIEDFGLCTHFKYHKKKLIFFLEAMKNYAEMLQESGHNLIYCQLAPKATFESQLVKAVKKSDARILESYEIEDRLFRERIKAFVAKHRLKWVVHPSPMFLHETADFTNYFRRLKQPRLHSFYAVERKRSGYLMSGGKPLGGRFSLDQENRKRLPDSVSVPPLPSCATSHHHQAVCRLVNRLFPTHIGTSEGCWLPVKRVDALLWLDTFLKERFSLFGDYQDAISQRTPFLFHSTLSPLLNCGLLTPHEVISHALKQKHIPLNAMEGFLRQILGWREFIRGIDEHFGASQAEANFFGHKRRLKKVWWSGKTGIEPVDHCIKNALKYGYCNHIERLMILSNVMLLLEVHPSEVYRWFMEMFIDSADWVMGPNVYGMGQFSDGGLFATKPYICGANYVLKMSSFTRGSWCDILDGLYWRFIDKQRAFFKKQPRLNMMLSTLDKMSKERCQHLFNLANTWQSKLTY